MHFWAEFSVHHTIIRAVFVCVWVCSLSPPRSFDGSLPNFVGVCRWTSHLPLRGSFSKRSMGRRVNGSFSLSTILYRDQPQTTQLQKAPFALVPQLQSLIRRLLLLHINGICRWTSQLLLRGSFSKRSAGQRVNRSNGSTGHFTFTILCMIADDARLTPPRCKKHTGSTGQWVHGSNRSTGHFYFHYIIYDRRRRQAHATLLQKAHGVSCHQAYATPLQNAHSVFYSLDG